MLLLDSHCDTPSQLIRLRNLALDNELAQVDFPKLRAGGVGASFFALYTPPGRPLDTATAYCMKMIARVRDAVAAAPGTAARAVSVRDILENRDKGLISILLGMENGDPVGEDLSLLRLFRSLGVRYVTLTHNADNLMADSSAGRRRWGGLSPFGREAVAEMNRLGILVDVAHASDETFYDCIRHSKAPIVSTHSCCRALAPHRRNMTDEMLRTLAAHDGVIQINFYPVFLSGEFADYMEASGLGDRADAVEARFIANPANPEARGRWLEMQRELLALHRPSYRRVVDHIDHAVAVAGIDHVGLGSDFDGIAVCPEGLEDISKIGVILEEMRRRGYCENDIAKVAGGNFLRVMEAAELVAQQSE